MSKNINEGIKRNIEYLIQIGEIETAKSLILQYKNFEADVEIYSIYATILIIENKIDEALKCLHEGYCKYKTNFDILYNIGYLYELRNEKELALEFNKMALYCCKDDEYRDNIKNKLSSLKNQFKTDELEENEIIKEFERKCYLSSGETDISEAIKYINLLFSKGNVENIIPIFNYYLSSCNFYFGEMFYFAGRAFNYIKKFDLSEKYHNIAVILEPYISNIVDKVNISYTNQYDEENIVCMGCGCDKFEVVNVSNQSISESNKGIINPIRRWVKCNECGLVYGNPAPREESLNQYYSIIAKEKFGGLYGNIKDREKFLFEMSNVRLDRIEKITHKRSLLDIGTGIGFFIKAALDRGYEAVGLELTPEDCEYAKNNYNLDLLQKNFYSFDDSEQYDIVTMFEVIEHMRTPLQDLKRINKLIKKDGYFVIATPILDSNYAKETKEENVFWNVVSHLSYFTKDVLINYLNMSGFKVLEIFDSMEGMGRMEFYCKKY